MEDKWVFMIQFSKLWPRGAQIEDKAHSVFNWHFTMAEFILCKESTDDGPGCFHLVWHGKHIWNLSIMYSKNAFKSTTRKSEKWTVHLSSFFFFFFFSMSEHREQHVESMVNSSWRKHENITRVLSTARSEREDVDVSICLQCPLLLPLWTCVSV